ncbi:serine protease, partial [Streptomyces sp. G35A]
MTDSFRRSGEYESPHAGDQQRPSSPVHPGNGVGPEWPPPPAYAPAQPSQPSHRKRARGPAALLAAVAIVA